VSAAARILIAASVGSLIGAGAFLGWRLVSDDDDQAAADPEETSTTASTVEVEAPWIEGGVRYETTVIVPMGLTVEDGVAALAYRADTISPALSRDDDTGEPGTPDDILFRPEQWVLEIAGSEPVAAVTGPKAREVRFPVPETAVGDDVVAVQVVGWRRAVLAGSSVTLPLEEDATGTLADGTVLTLRTVLEQATNTIIQVDVETPDMGDWHPDGPIARASDGRWRLSGGFGGGDFQMIWEGEDGPDEITLIQNSPMWEPVADQVTIIGEGGP